MRLKPISDTVPVAVNNYLLPHERTVIMVHQHPGMLVSPATAATGAFLAATAVSVVNSGPAVAKYIVWLLTAFLALRFLASVGSWARSYVVITPQRFLLISGLFNRKIEVSPLENLKEMITERSMAGRVLGYGAFRIGVDGPSQMFVDYIPYPEQLHLELNGILFKDDSE